MYILKDIRNMKYTKAQRRDIYLEAAESIFYGRNWFCCPAVSSTAFRLFKDSFYTEKDELMMFRPYNYEFTWWDPDDKQSRLNALLLCAEMCR
jgi:hypothetical protein